MTAAFRAHASGRSKSWHPHGDGIPKFSPLHCSTGSVLLVQALLTCRHVALFGYQIRNGSERRFADAAAELTVVRQPMPQTADEAAAGRNPTGKTLAYFF